jgi:predicted lipoprotein with Yx(FWY)xxD motif
MVLVSPSGMTLYYFQKDSGTESACYGSCAKVWPPLTTKGAPQVGEGAMSSELGTTKRTDGTTQVTYAGHPLYTYTADTSPGEANGNGISSFGGTWGALNASGSAVAASASTEGEAAAAPAESGSESSGSSGGYGY